MAKSFDIGIESLAAGDAIAPRRVHRHAASLERSKRETGPTAQALSTSEPSSAIAPGKSFFIETFGCQMNVHDAEKVAGVFLARGYRAAQTIAEADVMLYNTCSIREKAAQKVFSRLGAWRGMADGKIIGVIGCLAQQEGEDIFERAPWVSLVCGSASYRKLPEMVAELGGGGRRGVGPH